MKLPSCIQDLDLQSLPCEVGVYMVRLDCGPVNLASTSAAPQAACPSPVWAYKGRGLPQPLWVSSILKPFSPGLLAACALGLGWQLAAGQPSDTAQLCTDGCSLVLRGPYAGTAAGWRLSVLGEM